MKLPHALRASTLTLILTLALSACVVVPQTREVYDPDCRILTRQMTLETAVVGGFQRCHGDGCLAMLTAAGAITAASAVVCVVAPGGAGVYLTRPTAQQRPLESVTDTAAPLVAVVDTHVL